MMCKILKHPPLLEQLGYVGNPIAPAIQLEAWIGPCCRTTPNIAADPLLKEAGNQRILLERLAAAPQRAERAPAEAWHFRGEEGP